MAITLQLIFFQVKLVEIVIVLVSMPDLVSLCCFVL